MHRPAEEAANAAWYLQERRSVLTERKKHLALSQTQLDGTRVW